MGRNQNYIVRDKYLNKLKQSIGNKKLKVITGLTLVGKSVLLFNNFYDFLISQGVKDTHILQIHLYELEKNKLYIVDNLIKHYKTYFPKDNATKFVFINDINYSFKTVNVDDDNSIKDYANKWKELLDKENFEFYAVISYRFFEKNKLYNCLKGYLDIILVHPFSFYELSLYMKDKNKEQLWDYFSRFGGMPSCFWNTEYDWIKKYLDNFAKYLYCVEVEKTSYFKTNFYMKETWEYLINTMGLIINYKDINDYFIRNYEEKITQKDIEKYLAKFKESLWIRRANICYLNGQIYNNTSSKFYFYDIGMWNSLAHRWYEHSVLQISENLIFNELVNNGFKVSLATFTRNVKNKNNVFVKKIFNVDFMATKNKQKYFIQIVLDINNQKNLDRKKLSLLNLPIHYKKFIITKTDLLDTYYSDGIFYIQLYDFLLNPNMVENQELLQEYVKLKIKEKTLILNLIFLKIKIPLFFCLSNLKSKT